ncbi:TetR/AcrR family transcriptional regulator [Frankia sp. AiPs1]|uniref:TetR family transcriptional regulator n=1 Tax=Frankia sp. AiPs1 TaxID=573493 RepID=UPI0020441A7E|nr:TetR family transcriptional regulator [Frankia sp. AiPs1]MCM3920553.1 TetR/AcrR family transcriptional regulator [Frankia sp. AiPs1]
MSEKQLGLRERTRQAVRREIAETANALFVERGFDVTTIDDIAAAVGMSQRSVFRYFATKEEIVLGKFDLVVDDMLTTLRARPADEDVWTSLHHVFDVLVSLAEAPGYEALVEPIHRMVFDTPALLAGYLQRLQHMQDVVVTTLHERAGAVGTPYGAADPTPRALTAAAFGCLVAAQHSWLASGTKGSFAAAIDRAMATISPRVPIRSPDRDARDRCGPAERRVQHTLLRVEQVDSGRAGLDLVQPLAAPGSLGDVRAGIAAAQRIDRPSACHPCPAGMPPT